MLPTIRDGTCTAEGKSSLAAECAVVTWAHPLLRWHHLSSQTEQVVDFPTLAKVTAEEIPPVTTYETLILMCHFYRGCISRREAGTG